MWKSVEHYYQAQKYVGTPVFEEIRAAAEGFAARKAGGRGGLPVGSDWEQIKLSVMSLAVAAKFEQNRKLAMQLRSTHPDELVQISRTDLFWGRCPEGNGENHLGRILMEVPARLGEG